MGGLIKAADAEAMTREANAPTEEALKRCEAWMRALDAVVRERAADGFANATLSLASTEFIGAMSPDVKQALRLLDERVRSAGYSINMLLPGEFAQAAAVTVSWA